jgi:hypothetical protein
VKFEVLRTDHNQNGATIGEILEMEKTPDYYQDTKYHYVWEDSEVVRVPENLTLKEAIDYAIRKCKENR